MSRPNKNERRQSPAKTYVKSIVHGKVRAKTKRVLHHALKNLDFDNIHISTTKEIEDTWFYD